MNYKIYTKKDLLNESINTREEGKESVFTLFFMVQGLSFGVVYRPHYFSSVTSSHFSFYALSKGFEEFTETGYRSMFVQRVGFASYEEIEEYLLKQLKASIPFLSQERKMLQLGLF
jgi:hypothetical protein